MSTVTETPTPDAPRLIFDLGNFEGFNLRNQCAIPHNLTAAEVIAWDPDRDGQAEFWPAGDDPVVALLFQGRTLTAAELGNLNRLLAELGGDFNVDRLRLHHAVNVRGLALESLTREQVEEHPLHVCIGPDVAYVRHEAAYELFELYYEEEYYAWRNGRCEGLGFDPEAFLKSPEWQMHDVRFGDQVALLVGRH